MDGWAALAARVHRLRPQHEAPRQAGRDALLPGRPALQRRQGDALDHDRPAGRREPETPAPAWSSPPRRAAATTRHRARARPSRRPPVPRRPPGTRAATTLRPHEPRARAGYRRLVAAWPGWASGSAPAAPRARVSRRPSASRPSRRSPRSPPPWSRPSRARTAEAAPPTVGRAAITPTMPGPSAVLIDRDDRIRLTNGSDRTLVVLGYEGEPYLRFDAGGGVGEPALARRSTRTPALRRRRAPGRRRRQDARVGPRSSSRTYEWHDHRIHWMSPIRPGGEGGARARAPIFDWRVPGRAGASRV